MYCLHIEWWQEYHSSALCKTLKTWWTSTYIVSAIVSVSKYLGLLCFHGFCGFVPLFWDGDTAFLSLPWATVTLHPWSWTWGWCRCNIWNLMRLPDFPMIQPAVDATCLSSCCSPATFWWHQNLLNRIFTAINWWNPRNISEPTFAMWNTAAAALCQDNKDNKAMDKSHYIWNRQK